MDKKKISWWLSGGSSFNSNYQLVLNRAATEGYTPGNTAKGDALMTAIQGQLVNLDVLFIFWNSGSEGFGNINWVNPSGNLAVNNGSTWTSNVGYTTDGSTTFVNSNYVLNTLSKYAQDDASVGCYIKSNITGAVDLRVAFGARHVTLTQATNLLQRTGGSFRFPVNNTTASAAATGLTMFAANSWHIIKRNGTSQRYYENKTLKGTAVDASEGVPNAPIWIGGYNIASVLNNPLAAEFGAFFVGNNSLNTDLIVDSFATYITP